MRIAVFGLGYVGCVSAACLARLGHTVLGIDKDTFKVDLVNQGEAPFHEPELSGILAQAVQDGRLRASSSIGDELLETDAVIICVGTPSDPASGKLDLSFLRRVSEEIARAPRPSSLIVCIRSTVFPGVNEQIHHEVFGYDPSIKMVSNPEFLREGSAVKDFLEPSLIVVGGEDRPAVDQIAGLYRDLPCEPQITNLRTAEMIKYACNAFHALKIAFANEMGSLAHELGLDGGDVMQVLCRDTKLNVSAAYLRPGFAFGGSCLPKDLRALSYAAREASLRLPLLESVMPSNTEHLTRLVARAQRLPAGRLGVFGLAFKENTDDLRESPIVQLVELLLSQGRSLRIFDANIDLTKIHGANQRYLLEHLPHIHRLMSSDFDQWSQWSEALIVAQKPNGQLQDRLLASGKSILDLTV